LHCINVGCYVWSFKYCQFLIGNGADVNVKDNFGKIALDYARAHIIKDLLLLMFFHSLNHSNNNSIYFWNGENYNGQLLTFFCIIAGTSVPKVLTTFKMA
jgi:hypothetical protein